MSGILASVRDYGKVQKASLFTVLRHAKYMTKN